MFPFLGTIVKGISNALKLTNITVYDFDIDPGSTYAGVQLHADGNLKSAQGSASYVTTHTNEWIASEFHDSPGFDPNDYEGGYFSTTGNTPSGDARDTYISLHLSPKWYHNVSFGIRTTTGTLKVREKANPSNEVTCSCTITAEVDPGF